MDMRMPRLLAKLASAITPGAAVTSPPGNLGSEMPAMSAPPGVGASFGKSVSPVKSPATAPPLGGIAKGAGWGNWGAPPATGPQPPGPSNFADMQQKFQPPAAEQPQLEAGPVQTTPAGPGPAPMAANPFGFGQKPNGGIQMGQQQPAAPPQQQAAGPRVITTGKPAPAPAPAPVAAQAPQQPAQAPSRQQHQQARSPLPFNRWAASMQQTGAKADAAAKARTSVGSTYQSPQQKYGMDKSAGWPMDIMSHPLPQTPAPQQPAGGGLFSSWFGSGQQPAQSPGQAKPAPTQAAPGAARPAPAPQGGAMQQMGQNAGQSVRQAVQPVADAAQGIGKWFGAGQPKGPSIFQRMNQGAEQLGQGVQQGVQQAQQAPGNFMRGLMGGMGGQKPAAGQPGGLQAPGGVLGKSGADEPNSAFAFVIAGMAKQAAQADHDGPMKRSSTGASKGLSYNNKKDHYAQGPDAWASVSGYLKKKPESEPNPFEGKHA